MYTYRMPYCFSEKMLQEHSKEELIKMYLCLQEQMIFKEHLIQTNQATKTDVFNKKNI